MATKTLLVETHPEIAAEWHPARNGDLDPDTLGTYSNKKVWWLHSDWRGDLHQWQQIVRNRTYTGSGCPRCVNPPGRRQDFDTPEPGKSFADLHPALAATWHPTRNGDLTALDLKPYSARSVWWQCEQGHEFVCSLASRLTIYTICPRCRTKVGSRAPKNGVTLAAGRPDLAADWHPTKNGDRTPDHVALVSNEMAWWRGAACGHTWRARTHNRVKLGTGCPACNRASKMGVPSGKGKTGSLAERYPNIAAQWHPTKNGDLTPDDVTSKSSLKRWWLCPDGHEWKQSPSHRATRGDHPTCWACARPIKIAESDLPTGATGTLADRHPDIASWWHPSRNGHLSPGHVRPAANAKVWWACPKGHQWQAAPNSRVNGSGGCRRCSNREERNSRDDVVAAVA